MCRSPQMILTLFINDDSDLPPINLCSCNTIRRDRLGLTLSNSPPCSGPNKRFGLAQVMKISLAVTMPGTCSIRLPNSRSKRVCWISSMFVMAQTLITLVLHGSLKTQPWPPCPTRVESVNIGRKASQQVAGSWRYDRYGRWEPRAYW